MSCLVVKRVCLAANKKTLCLPAFVQIYLHHTGFMLEVEALVLPARAPSRGGNKSSGGIDGPSRQRTVGFDHSRFGMLSAVLQVGSYVRSATPY